MKRTVLPALLASVLVLSGCGNSGDDEAKTAISDYFSQQQGGQQGSSLKEGQADCVAGQMVDDIGVDQLKEYKVLNDDGSFNEKIQGFEMSQEDAEVMANAFLTCTDTLDQMRSQIESAPQASSPEAKKCFDELLNEENIRSMMVASFSGDQEKAAEFQQELMGCAAAGMPSPDSTPSPTDK
ncbi:MAG TPA: hypothetical protein VLB29_05680 [Nocardioidaceae bacterium]|nr:hypothetical protein [Nocardioidaceae bacterium]